jgi:hypothetical protein
MAKTKQLSQKAKPTQIVVEGNAYSCLRKNGKVTVRTARTAQGQNLIAGIYDIANQTWISENDTLSTSVKNQIAKLVSR